MTTIARAELTAIRYLGWIGEALTLGAANGYPDQAALKTAGKCCDRIEHIAQYALEELDQKYRATYLVDYALFMRAALREHEKALGSGLPFSLPSNGLLDNLLSIANTLAE